MFYYIIARHGKDPEGVENALAFWRVLSDLSQSLLYCPTCSLKAIEIEWVFHDVQCMSYLLVDWLLFGVWMDSRS